MKYKKYIIHFLFTSIFILFLVNNIANAQQGSDNFTLLLKDSALSNKLAQSKKTFLDLFITLFNIVVALAGIWAVIEISYYGARYVLVDSFTGKKDAIKNIWPVAYGLGALLATVILFNQINPQILTNSPLNGNGGASIQLRSPELPAPNLAVTNAESPGAASTPSTLNLNHITNAGKSEIAETLKKEKVQKNIRNNLKKHGGPNGICGVDRLCKSFIKDMRNCSGGIDDTACSRVSNSIEQSKYHEIYKKLIDNP